jgi:hypothetical protein
MRTLSAYYDDAQQNEKPAEREQPALSGTTYWVVSGPEARKVASLQKPPDGSSNLPSIKISLNGVLSPPS